MRRPPAQSHKILITIPYWDGDRNQAMLMAKLLADLEPKHSDLADILFVHRFDSKKIDPEGVKYISRKFNVLQHRSARKETGWPAGCNGILWGMLEYVYHKSEAKQIPQYKAIFNMASDVVPLRQDWLPWLHAQWDAIRRKDSTCCMAGAFIQNHDARDHINGDACFLATDYEFLKWLVRGVGGIRVRCGWDWLLASDFCDRGWSDIAGIKSLWQTPTMTQAEAEAWIKRKVFMIHGVKDNSLLEHARKILL